MFFCSIPFGKHPDGRPAISSSLLIQISSLRRNKNVLKSVIYLTSHLLSHNVDNRCLSGVRVHPWYMTSRARRACPAHQTRMSLYITTCRQENLASRENYASELHQAMTLRLSKVDQTSCDQMSAMVAFTLCSSKIL